MASKIAVIKKKSYIIIKRPVYLEAVIKNHMLSKKASPQY